jgi:hypothetical protein
MVNPVEKIERSLKMVEKWVEDHNYMAYEPFDGLSSVFRPLTFKNVFLDRLLMQLIRQSPINLRPIMGVRPLPSTKGQGYMAWGYLARYKQTRDEAYKSKALSILEWLDKNKSPKYKDHSWANHFDFASRGGRYYKHDSIVVWTALIGHAYLDAYDLFRLPRHLEIINSIKRWVLALPRTKGTIGFCIAYMPQNNSLIHNASMLGAGFLARAGKLTGDAEALNVAREAMSYHCEKQLPDGSWWYGEEANNRWIDNFHTGYNLDSLKYYIEYSGDESYRKNLTKGFEFYKDNFFEKSGRPKYYHNRIFPVDSQCAGQALETLARFGAEDKKALDLAFKVAEWWIDNMQDKDGHFYYRQYPGNFKAKAPMMHWAQATNYRGLALLLSRL